MGGNCGGKRIGSGAKADPVHGPKRMLSIRMPVWVIEWLKGQEESQSVLVERALVKTYEIKRGE